MPLYSKITIAVSLLVILLSLTLIGLLPKPEPPTGIVTEEAIDTSVRIAVLNGCGREGLAGQFTTKLREMGYDAVNGMGSNADSFDFDISVVVNRENDIEKAREVATRLGIRQVLDQRSDKPYLLEDIIIILGRDWDTLKLQ